MEFSFQEHVSLAQYSTFGIGGRARYFIKVTDTRVMQRLLSSVEIPFLVIGKGSNVLFDDTGFDGLVILNAIDFMEQQEGLFHVGAGYSFARLGKVSARRGYTGLEFASGIPATVGGAIYMNAGASGQETERALQSVTFLEKGGEERLFQRERLHFGYRTSSFQQMEGVIVEATFMLEKKEGAAGAQRELLGYRLKTQPYQEKSAGCAFRNPEGDSAGRLIESCGLKGERVGGAMVSTTHANFIINTGGAQASDVLELMEIIKNRVFREKGICLEGEVRYISGASYESI